jgi:Rrf2 family protein
MRTRQTERVRISAKADYAVRAAIELAGASRDAPVKGDTIATAQSIPLKFLENILSDMRHADLIASRRGAEGGYWLALPPQEITVADIIRAVEGPMATVRGERPDRIEYAGSAEPLQRVWIAVRAALRSVAEEVTLADLASGDLPPDVAALADDPKAWMVP